MRVILIPPSIFAAQAASGQAAFVPDSHAFAVKLEPKRAASKPVNMEDRFLVCCTGFVLPSIPNVAGAIALHCRAGTSGLQVLIPLGC